ncbi:hypothetical protein [Rhizobium lentis]|uniref:hypothetical protein n=1 Tax=Rhizobium lentis TaxID=1138194 RepID=UPI001C8336E5|nr:hypothetical protein [Rhizobium lentis]MBX5049028.1 hypothetical protein [Rhizobium lentis]MBX5060710.1 hypothetical protein [Rhizobium lentis]
MAEGRLVSAFSSPRRLSPFSPARREPPEFWQIFTHLYGLFALLNAIGGTVFRGRAIRRISSVERKMFQVTITWENRNQIKNLVERIRENVDELGNRLREVQRRERLTQEDVDECVRLLTLGGVLLAEFQQIDAVCPQTIASAVKAAHPCSWLALQYL